MQEFQSICSRSQAWVRFTIYEVRITIFKLYFVLSTMWIEAGSGLQPEPMSLCV